MAGIERIGGGGMISAANSPKSRPQNTEIRVSDVAPKEQVRLDTPVVGAAEGKGNSQADAKRQEGEIFGKDVTPEKARAAVEDLNRQVRQASPIKHTQLSFKYHDDTNRISITVTDSDTDEVIREIPPEKALDMLAKAWEMAGLLVDEKR